MHRKILPMLLILLLVLTAMPIFPMHVNAASTGTFDLETGGWRFGSSDCYAWDGITLTVNDGADFAVTGHVTNTSNIVVNGTATITLDNASIAMSIEQTPITLDIQ